MNEQTHFFIKNISLTLYFWKGWCWLCVRGELETGTDCYILTQFLLTIAALLSHLDFFLSVCRWLSLRHLVPNWLQPARTTSFTWLYNCLTPTSFRCSSAYLHRWTCWLTVNMLQSDWNMNLLTTIPQSIALTITPRGHPIQIYWGKWYLKNIISTTLGILNEVFDNEWPIKIDISLH